LLNSCHCSKKGAVNAAVKQMRRGTSLVTHVLYS
jgi:hypothetical protein